MGRFFKRHMWQRIDPSLGDFGELIKFVASQRQRPQPVRDSN
jgi:hypothetical protein